MQVSVEGKMVEVSDGASCADALKEGLSGKRFKAAIACKAGDTLLDLTAPVPTTTETLTLTPVTADTPEGLSLIRHSAAHVMAAAVKKLFPAAKVTIGPSIENGFYYDFDVETPFSPDQFEAIDIFLSSYRYNHPDRWLQALALPVRMEYRSPDGYPVPY